MLSTSKGAIWQPYSVGQTDYAKLMGQHPFIVWFTGLSGSGKSSIANGLQIALQQSGYRTYVLDGDNVRHGLNRDLGFSDSDRAENIRRVSEVAKLMLEAGLIVITTLISPRAQDRQQVRSLFDSTQFVEVFVDTPLEVCEQRDPKGLYKKARRGEIKDFTGIGSVYNIPKQPEVTLETTGSVEACSRKLWEALVTQGFLKPRDRDQDHSH